jgi:ABC-type sugar transport system permease subunit
MPLWQRLLITLVTMLLTSFIAGLLWRWLFSTDIPSYLSGVVGGITGFLSFSPSSTSFFFTLVIGFSSYHGSKRHRRSPARAPISR